MTDHLPGEPGSAGAQGIRGFFVRVLSLVGLFFGAGSAAAAGDLVDLQQTALRQDRLRVLTPEMLAVGVVKGYLDMGEAGDEAGDSGVDGARFRAMVDIAGNPPGPETLLTMLRRRIIDRDRVAHGIRQGLIKNEWTDQLLALQHSPISVADAVQASVQNFLAKDEAADIAERQGIARAGFDVLYNIAGNPPGPMEVLTMWQRGILTEQQVDQALRESRLKDKYIGPLKGLVRRRIPLRTITTLLNHGVIPDAQAQKYLTDLGYSIEDAQALIASSKATKTTAHKELSVTAIRSLYTDRLITRDQAIHDLVVAGYQQGDASLVLDLADAEALQRLRSAAITKVRSIFVAHHMDRATASIDLDRLGVPPDQRDHMLDLWQLEQEANVKVLTPAQVVKAGKEGIIGPDEVIARLRVDGYSEQDAIILAMLGGAIDLPAPPG